MSLFRSGFVAALALLAAFPAVAQSSSQSSSQSASPAAGQDDEEDNAEFLRTFAAWPKPAEMRSAFPAGATVTGRARIECTVAAKGALLNCAVLREIPAGQGFGAAAMSLSNRYRARIKDEAGASTIGAKVSYWAELLAPGDANPNWVRKPTGQDLAGVFPVAAVKAGKDGAATIHCRVTVDGFLDRCVVISETPEGLGFGPAALALAPQFRMSPMIRGGKPQTGEVTVPINWKGLSGAGLRTVSKERLLIDPPWKQAPTSAQVDAAWPKGAAGLDAGQAAIRCRLKTGGALRGCEVISELPAGKGFGKAALVLADQFLVSLDPNDNKLAGMIQVDVPVRFRAPGSTTRKLTRPRWIRAADPEAMAAAFPEAARKAGVTVGTGVVSCLVTAEGRLTDCEAVREEPLNLDFAAAAMTVAGTMRMNLWTTEGDPVDGQRIRLPVRFEETGPAAAEKPADKTTP